MPITAKSLLSAPNAHARCIGHTELWFGPGSGRPADKSRNPGYNQQDIGDATKHLALLQRCGVDCLMFNTYALGSWENRALVNYLNALRNSSLNFCINIDKAIYRGKPNPLAELRTYVAWLRNNCFNMSNYEIFNGKYIVTYFAMPGDSRDTFATIEKENADCIFVYNGAQFGHSQMAWVHSSGSEAALESWCKAYANVHDGGLYIPCVAPGFNDTFQGHSVWDANSPARVYPAGVGPNAKTLAAHYDVLNKYYMFDNPLQYFQVVTVNDWDEGTACEPFGLTGAGFIAPPAVVSNVRGEIWLDGHKLTDVPTGQHHVVVKVIKSDGSANTTPVDITV
jgi:hypothetical protein